MPNFYDTLDSMQLFEVRDSQRLLVVTLVYDIRNCGDGDNFGFEHVLATRSIDRFLNWAEVQLRFQATLPPELLRVINHDVYNGQGPQNG